MQVKLRVKIYIFSDFLCLLGEGMVGRPGRSDLGGLSERWAFRAASAPERVVTCNGVRRDGTENRAPDTEGSAFTCPVNKHVQKPVHGGDGSLHPWTMTAGGSTGVSVLPYATP